MTMDTLFNLCVMWFTHGTLYIPFLHILIKSHYMSVKCFEHPEQKVPLMMYIGATLPLGGEPESCNNLFH